MAKTKDGMETVEAITVAQRELERAHMAYTRTVDEVLDDDEVMDAIQQRDPEGAKAIREARVEWEKAGQNLHDVATGRAS